MSETEQPQKPVCIEPWEMDLLRKVARRFRTPDREELEAELARKLVILKANKRPDILNWPGYLAKFFFNKAANWIRDDRARNRRKSDLQGEIDDSESRGLTATNAFGAFKQNPDLAPAFAAAWHELDPVLRNLCTILLEENGNRARVARRLKRHRNTVRAWVRKIQAVITAHGLQPALRVSQPKAIHRVAIFRRATSQANPPRRAFTVMSGRLLRVLLVRRLSGTQWRFLLWVIRQAARRKQRMIPLQWSDASRALSLNRSSAWRAGRALNRIGILCIEKGRIGLRRDFGMS